MALELEEDDVRYIQEAYDLTEEYAKAALCLIEANCNITEAARYMFGTASFRAKDKMRFYMGIRTLSNLVRDHVRMKLMTPEALRLHVQQLVSEAKNESDQIRAAVVASRLEESDREVHGKTDNSDVKHGLSAAVSRYRRAKTEELDA